MIELAFGMGCPHCGYSAGVLIGSGLCPSCGKGLKPLPNGAGAEIVTSFECSKCGHSVGMMVGFDGHCPECGAPAET